jgi:DNA-directed RNA polymerase|tara:strand:+ start:10122 stop:12575 length:2454 start_codon:yes stop_codon:yes gene_type:complete
MSTLEEKQIELETEMGSLGVANYFKNLEMQGQADNMVGITLLNNSIQPLVDKLNEFAESTKSGQARRLASTSRYLEMIGHKEVAYLSLKRIINGISSRERLVSMAESITKLLEDELNYRAFRKEAPRLMDKIIRNLKATAANAKHKRKVILASQTNLTTIEKITLPDELRIKIGLKIIELVTELNLCVIKTRSEGKTKRVSYVESTDSLRVWIALQNKTCSLLSPVFLPMVCKPKPWTNIYEGGYLETRLTLMKTRNKKYLSELDQVDMPVVFNSLNALQETPWRINKPVYNVMHSLWETTGGGIAKLPLKDGKPIPMKPTDIDTNPAALKEWKKTASQTHTENFRNRSKVVAVAKKLWLAEKFLDDAEIYFPHVLDWRGRAYPIPGFINPQADDSGKALLQFTEGKPLGTEGAAWLAIHLANTYGFDKEGFDKRISWAEENSAAILDSALKPLEGSRFWLLADKPFQFLAACFEWLGYTMQGEDYISRIAVALDGSCNGLQNFSAMLRDERGGQATNLSPSEKPSDIYQEVADIVQIAVASAAKEGHLEATTWMNALYKEGDAYVKKPIGRKLTKRNTMTRPYSVSAYGMRDQLIKELDVMVEEKDILFAEGTDVAMQAYYLAGENLKAISQVVVAAEEGMKWLQAVSKVVSKASIAVVWTSPIGLPVRQYYSQSISEIVRVCIAGTPTNIQFNKQGDTLNTRKQSAGISPNFVHSCDAAHMMATVEMCREEGLTSFSMIHDSYAVHACDTRQLADNLRKSFVNQYTVDVLQGFKEEIEYQLKGAGYEELISTIPPLPAYGTLELTAVLDSEYFFA